DSLKKAEALIVTKSLVILDSINDIVVLSAPHIASQIESLVNVESLVESDTDVHVLVVTLIDVEGRSEL
ncbi:hypothetical protein, partial [Staphylococcus aureus]